MALVLSPWFGRGFGRGCGRGCGQRARLFSFGNPSLFTDLVIIKVPQIQRQASCAAPLQEPSPAMTSARVVQWSETADAHIFKLRLPGLKKEDLQIQVEDDRTLYISYSKHNPKEEAKETKDVTEAKEAREEEPAAESSQSAEQKSPSGSFRRKFKLPENADLEQIKAEVTNETLTVTMPKRKPQSPETRKIEVSEGEAPATSQATASVTPSHKGKAVEDPEQPSLSEATTSSA